MWKSKSGHESFDFSALSSEFAKRGQTRNSEFKTWLPTSERLMCEGYQR